MLQHANLEIGSCLVLTDVTSHCYATSTLPSVCDDTVLLSVYNIYIHLHFFYKRDTQSVYLHVRTCFNINIFTTDKMSFHGLISFLIKILISVIEVILSLFLIYYFWGR